MVQRIQLPPIFLVAALLLICAQCKNASGNNSIAQTTAALPQESLQAALQRLGIPERTTSNRTYQQTCAAVQALRASLQAQHLSVDSLSRLFESCLVDSILPYWYGTPWSFDGHTATPGKGEIACGYLVSTTLTDMGLRINKFKLAQQLPENEAASLSLDKPVRIIKNASIEDNIQAINSTLADGIYFLGFDQSHVGYLLKRKDSLFVIHSNYLNGEGVLIEKASESRVFSYYNRLHIAEVSTNASLLERWVSGKTLKVKTGLE